jgi:hypothetical protein
MAFIPLPDGVKIEIKYRKNGALVVNVMWGIVTATIDLNILENIGSAVHAWWLAHRDDQVVAAMALEEIIVTDWSVANGLQGVVIVSPPAPGTNTGTDLPSNIATVVSLYTGFSGRSYRGRQYWCGVPEASITANSIATAYVALMISDMGELIDALAAEGCVVCVASFQSAGVPRVTGVATPVTNWGADNVVDTQRRRIPQVFS